MVATPAAVSRLPDGGRFVALDALRGLAALGVAFRHINGTDPLLTSALHENLGMAVDFFFVLSGFVIAASYGERLQRGFSTLRFMLLRYGRVWPLHAAVVGCYVALELAYMAWDGGGALAGRAPFTDARDPLALPVSLLLLQAYVFPSQDVWNVQSWSISVEVGLYFAAAWLWRMAGRAGTWIALAAGIAALVLLAFDVLSPWSWVLRGIGGFGFGMACWAVWPRVSAISLPRWAAAVLELALPVAALLAIHFGVWRLLADIVFAALVLLFAREQGPVSRLLRTAPFVWLGTLSYSLFMIHGLVFGRVFDGLGLVQHRVGAHWVDATIGGIDRLLLPPVLSGLAALAMLALALAAAWLAWRFVEWPARDWSRRRAAEMGVGREEARAPTI